MTLIRQTTSYLRQRFEEVGLEPNRKLGQNFLIDLNLLDVLISEADLQADDVVLEVGTGTGSLTARLAERVAAVVTVEIDQHLHQLASEELHGRQNVVMLQQDALKNKNRIHPTIIETVQQQLQQTEGGRFKLVANLPYCIATPMISNLLEAEIIPNSMTVTIQKELADRVVARSGTKDYSALSIWVQSLCDVQLLRVLPPTAFWPRPRVSSAILRILPREEKRARISHVTDYHQFVRSLFFHRRKYLRSVLLSALKNQLEKAQVDEIMTELGLGPDSRAEQLEVNTVLALFDVSRRKIAG